MATGLCAGTYNAYIVDGLSDTSGTVSVTVGEPSVVGIIITTTPAPGDTNGVVTALGTGGTNPYFYLWSTTPPQTTASAVGLNSGTYYVTITDANGCTAVDSGTVTVGIDDLLVNASILLYPNPVADELYVDAELDHNALFIAYNIVGEQVITESIERKLNRIGTSNLSDGMYLFQLLDNEGRVIQRGKFTVER